MCAKKKHLGQIAFVYELFSAKTGTVKYDLFFGIYTYHVMEILSASSFVLFAKFRSREQILRLKEKLVSFNTIRQLLMNGVGRCVDLCSGS